MENLRLPAYPLPIAQNQAAEIVDSSEWNGNVGFTKLELASLMIAQGIAASGFNEVGMHSEHPAMAQTSVSLAKAVLEEANK